MDFTPESGSRRRARSFSISTDAFDPLPTPITISITVFGGTHTSTALAATQELAWQLDGLNVFWVVAPGNSRATISRASCFTSDRWAQVATRAAPASARSRLMVFAAP